MSQEKATLQGVIEKKTMINMIQAFSVSVKHFLRSEPGVYYQDLYPLISFLPRYANPDGAHTRASKVPLWSTSDDIEEAHSLKRNRGNPRSAADIAGNHPQRTVSLPADLNPSISSEDTKSVGSSGWFRSLGRNSKPRHKKFDPEKVLPEVESRWPLKPARNPPVSTVYDYIPLLRFFKWIFRTIARKTMPPEEIEARLKRKKLDRVESNVPVEICLVLSSYTAYLMRNNLVQPAIATGVTNNITLLQDTLSNLERIRNTPLPFAYQFHLRISLWLYLAFLPFQIYSTFGYLTIPGTTFASFLLLGFLEIGQEIENPFNYDLNDLDLDHFCLSIQRELHEITAYTHPDPYSFIFDPRNIPFAPSDRRNAAELVEDLPYQAPQHGGEIAPPGIASIRHTLVNSWKQVDRDTRPDRASAFAV
ncbi:hypothetical protein H0H81_007626 [Sphagnurus paluster]|uniref:Uncharacterized protein n=1 Tax=Sphagnurus paluster TaxID=117069 RepID=A0A9P7GJE0_9AGAR|nr:hypothetical protein H0H81_007626 [Sphagnurus paluster]